MVKRLRKAFATGLRAFRGLLPPALELGGASAVVWAVGALFGVPAAVLLAGAIAIAVAYRLEG